MSSDDEASAQDLDVSDRETQFVPRSDDDETLWEVQEITAERGKKYRVRWVGLDPATGKPWAQSWVAKHDCTDKLVGEWKAKKKKRGRPSTKSRSSVSSKSDRTTSIKKETRPSTSKAASSSRLNAVQEEGDASPPPKKSTLKRKRQSEIPVAEMAGASSSRDSSVENLLAPPPKKPPAKRKRQSGTPAEAPTIGGQPNDTHDSESSRPRKKQKSMVDVLLPPLDSDEDIPLGPRANVAALKQKPPPKPNDASSDEDSPPPKGKPGVLLRKKSLPKDDAARSEVSGFGEAQGPLAPKNNAVSRSNPNNGVRLARETLSAEPKGVAKLKRKAPSPRPSHLSEHEFEPTVSPPIKVGPPRGGKRQGKQKQSESSHKPGPSRPKPRPNDLSDENTNVEDEQGQLDTWAAPDSPMLAQDVVDLITPISPPRFSTPPVPVTRRRSPHLSPGARARLELFDRMMAETEEVHQPVIDPDAYEPPLPPSPTSPPKSKPRPPKPSTPNGLVVPETESSGNSQSQSQSQTQSQPQPPKPPVLQIPVPQPSPRKPIDLPTIAVISASTPSTTISPDDLLPPPQRRPPPPAGPKKPTTMKLLPHISPNTFRSRLRASVEVDEAPPSSIESFASPKRVDKGKGKQKAVDEVEVEVEAEIEAESEAEDGSEFDDDQQAAHTRSEVTDSALRKRGQELARVHHLTREAERQMQKGVGVGVKTNVGRQRRWDVDEIVNGTFSSSPMGSSLPFTGGGDNLNANASMPESSVLADQSTTLETVTQGQSVPKLSKVMTEEEQARLRIELRQEEEESTQEALGYVVPPSAVVEFGVQNINGGDVDVDVGDGGGGDVGMSPPHVSKDSLVVRPVDEGDLAEQPSADLQLASVLVQPSQGQRHEDTDFEPGPTNPTTTTSSPVRPLPENLSDSPKRRLGEALSLLHVKSEEIQRLERELNDARQTIHVLQTDLTDARRSPNPSEAAVAAWETERADWLQMRETLEGRVGALGQDVEQERAARMVLEGERAAWVEEREEMVAKMAGQSALAELTKIRGEHSQDRVRWEAEKVSWEEEKVKSEQERAAMMEKQDTLTRMVEGLRKNVGALEAGKASVETDRDFFKEQYAQASGFVGSVRAENVELEKRAKIAEGQAQEGVAAIKAFFEGRVQALQQDLDRWKGLAELLQEKDRRTNDELRSRAAQAPELQDLCRQLTEENTSLEAELRKLGRSQQRTVVQRNKLYYEIMMLKKERASFKSKLAKTVKIIDGSTQETQGASTISTMQPAVVAAEEIEVDPNDMEILPEPISQPSQIVLDEPVLFPCMWRPQLRDRCQHIFDTKEDLERHLQEHYRDLVTQ